MTKPSLGTTDAGDLLIDVPRLLATRMLLDAESGGGKTVALKRLLEQTHGYVQQIIIDPEGEFPTLRERFDYLLCAPEGADAIANPKTAAILARKLRETRVSAVIDIYDLRPAEQRLFVRLFVEELLAAPKNLWNPCLVVIDEAQIFAPEQGEAESLGAIMDLRGRGRKRGLCLILATPRLAQLSKDACAGLQNKLIGVTTLDLDVKRAARDLSMTPVEATTLLRNLEPGEFYCFGPALTRAITKVKIGPIQTSHGAHTASKDARPPEPSEKIKSVIAKLTDLPKAAEQEARTVDDLKRENTQLKRELTLAKKAAPSTPTKIERIEVPVVGKRAVRGLQEAAKEMHKAMVKIRDIHGTWAHNLKVVEDRITAFCTTVEKVSNPMAVIQPGPLKPASVQPVSKPAYTPAPARVANDAMKVIGGNGAASNLSAAARKVLAVLAQYPEGCAAGKLTLLTGYRYSGGFKNSLSELRTAGLITGGNTDTMRITNAGLALGPFELLPQGRALVDYWLAHSSFGVCERRVLAELVNHQLGLSAEELCDLTGYAYSGGFKNALSNLRTAGVLVGGNTARMRASAELLNAARDL